MPSDQPAKAGKHEVGRGARRDGNDGREGTADHPFNPGKYKYPFLLPFGGMIILGITTTTLGFLLWPEPKPHYDTSTEGVYWPDAGIDAGIDAGVDGGTDAIDLVDENPPVDAPAQASDKTADDAPAQR